MSDRDGQLRSLASLLAKLTRAAAGKHGFAESGLIDDWAAIAGPEIAAHSVPERLDFTRGERLDGTLHLRVEGAWALALQHLEPQLIERVNASLGYGAVARIRLHQGPLPKKAASPKPPPTPVSVEPRARAALAAQVGAIEDPALRQAVERLGLALLSAESAAAPGAHRTDGQ